jgi:hypothetical protein
MSSFDILTIKQSGEHFVNSDPMALEILRCADGKRTYKEIAKEFAVSPTRVSSVLSLSEKLGLSTKVQRGLYKRNRGVLQHISGPARQQPRPVDTSKAVVPAKNKTVRIPKELKLKVQSSQGMAVAYLWLYETENALRNLLRRAFANENDWWNSRRVNPEIRKSVDEAIAKYPYHGAKRKDELEYTHLGQLKEIVIAKPNWDELKEFLHEVSKANFASTVDKAIPSRNSIAHSTPLTPSDLKVVQVRFNDILAMLK